MKKMMIWMLVMLCMVPPVFAEESCPLEFQMELSQTQFAEPGEVTVTISVTNVSRADMPGPMALYYPNGKMIAEFDTPTLLAGETRTWQGMWNVTKEQIDAGKVVFAIQYTCLMSDGSIGRKMQAYYVPVAWISEVPKPQQVKIELAGDSSTGYSWEWGPCNGRIIVDIACEVSETGDACYTLTGLEAGETTLCFTYDEAWYTERDPNFARYAIYYDIHVDEKLNVSIMNTEFIW